MSRGTGQKCIRLDDETWAAFGALAEANGTTRTELLRQWINEYLASSERPKGRDRR